MLIDDDLLHETIPVDETSRRVSPAAITVGGGPSSCIEGMISGKSNIVTKPCFRHDRRHLTRQTTCRKYICTGNLIMVAVVSAMLDWPGRDVPIHVTI